MDVRRDTRSFEHLGGYVVRNFTVVAANGAERLTGVSVTPNLFPMLGIEPALGRTFTPADAAAPSGFETAVILTHGIWQSHYGGDPDIIGRAVIINDRAWTVVGVMPPGFRFPHLAQLYAPLFLDAGGARTIRTVSGIALLKPGTTRQQAQADVDAVAARLESAFLTTNRGYGMRVLTFRDSQVAPQTRIAMGALMTAVVFVLLIACANLANLLFVRGAARPARHGHPRGNGCEPRTADGSRARRKRNRCGRWHGSRPLRRVVVHSRHPFSLAGGISVLATARS